MARIPSKKPSDKSNRITTYNDFEDFFNKFCFDYNDLIDTFESVTNHNISKLKILIYQAFQDIQKPINYENILLGAIHASTFQNKDIIEELARYSQEDYEYEKSSLQRYFDDVGRVYKKNNNDFDIEYSLENRDKLIEMNLKNVITIAKRYRGNRLSLEELISAGNEGLCVAFNKYNPKRQKLRDNLISQIESIEEDTIDFQTLKSKFETVMSYGNTKALFCEHFKADKTYTKNEVLAWIKKYIRPAKFNSVAVMWINAYILIELDNFSRLIKKPKSEIKKEKTGESPREVYYDLSEPIGTDGSHTLGDIIETPDDTVEQFEVDEAQQLVKDTLKILMEGIKLRNKRITLQRFGIGLPRPLSPKEISQRENISIARVSQIIQMTLDDMRANYEKYKNHIDPNLLYDILGRCENYV